MIFVYLGVAKEFEPLLLIPIGFGIIVGNMPGVAQQGLGVMNEGSVLNYLYFGVSKSIYPSLIFLGIGAMTDFSTLIANPRLILLGAAAVSYTHLRAHETPEHLVCRLLLEKKKTKLYNQLY